MSADRFALIALAVGWAAFLTLATHLDVWSHMNWRENWFGYIAGAAFVHFYALCFYALAKIAEACEHAWRKD